MITICPNAILLDIKLVDSGNATTKALTAAAAADRLLLFANRAGPTSHKLSAERIITSAIA
jgi:hypothetical protein